MATIVFFDEVGYNFCSSVFLAVTGQESTRYLSHFSPQAFFTFAKNREERLTDLILGLKRPLLDNRMGLLDVRQGQLVF